MSKIILAKKSRLTQREYDIVVLITIRMSYEAITKRLGISAQALNEALVRIMWKLKRFSHSALIALARSEGWVRSIERTPDEIKHVVMTYEQIKGVPLIEFVA